MSFESSLATLSKLEGFQGAAILHYGNKEVLTKTNSYIDMSTMATGLSEIIKAEVGTMQLMNNYDLVTSILITTKNYYHVIRIVPYFDDVALYLVVNRQKALSIILQEVETAIDNML